MYGCYFNADYMDADRGYSRVIRNCIFNTRETGSKVWFTTVSYYIIRVTVNYVYLSLFKIQLLFTYHLIAFSQCRGAFHCVSCIFSIRSIYHHFLFNCGFLVFCAPVIYYASCWFGLSGKGYYILPIPVTRDTKQEVCKWWRMAERARFGTAQRTSH